MSTTISSWAGNNSTSRKGPKKTRKVAVRMVRGGNWLRVVGMDGSRAGRDTYGGRSEVRAEVGDPFWFRFMVGFVQFLSSPVAQYGAASSSAHRVEQKKRPGRAPFFRLTELFIKAKRVIALFRRHSLGRLPMADFSVGRHYCMIRKRG